MNKENQWKQKLLLKKINKLLAILTKKKREKLQITKIRNESGTLLLILQKQKKIIKEYMDNMVSCIAGGFFTNWGAIREALILEN